MTSVANISGNALVLASGATSPACRKRVAAFILNLAVADLFAIVGLLSLAVDAINYVSTVEYFDEGFLAVLCYGKLYGIFSYYFAQIFTMAGVAINRCWRIVYADTFTHYMQWGGHYVTIALVWFLSFLFFGACILWFGLEAQYTSWESGRSMNSTYGGYCNIVPTSGSGSEIVRISAQFIPGIIVGILCAFGYAQIFKYFYESRTELKTLAAESNNSSPTISNNFKNLHLHIATVCVLLVTQILGIILVVLTFLSIQYKPWVMLMSYYIYLLNSSINPWLSIKFIKDFQCAVHAMSKCKSFRSYKRKEAISNLLMINR